VTDATFERDVLASDLPVAVDFWSSKCPPCHVMKGLLEEIGPEFAGRVNIFKLNVDQNPRTTAKYQIMKVPTLILFQRGEPKDAIVGLLPLDPLREELNKLTS
jgi:thioredoxin 1